jgi:hypothetical protein
MLSLPSEHPTAKPASNKTSRTTSDALGFPAFFLLSYLTSARGRRVLP